jgi:pimeloyl-ACP methyl ester carboxylesterase
MGKLLVLLVVGVAFAIASIGALHRNRFRYVPEPLGLDEFGRLGSDGFVAEEVEIEPGVVVRGLVRAPAADPATWLVMYPGNGGGLLGGARELCENLTAGTGWGVAIWAYRGFDGSGGAPSAAKLRTDSEALWVRLQTKFGADPARTHLISFSFGTALALHIAALSSASGAAPASLVLMSPYQRIQVMQNTWWAPWSVADTYDALAEVPRSSSPVLVVWGASDDAFPAGTARGLAAALGPRARALELPGRGHAGWQTDAAVLEQMRAFLRQHTPP